MSTQSPSPASAAPAVPRASTGVAGLDAVLDGGLPANHLYLLDGEPGTGKTTLALQFLMAGVARGERVLYVTLSESTAELRGIAASHGWPLDGIEIFELAAQELREEQEGYTIFHPAEVELQQTMDAVIAAADRHAPSLLVFDSLSEMRLLARDPLRFRRQILALKHYFAQRQCTVLLLDDKTSPDGDLQLHSLAHGVIVLEHVALEYGAERRRLQVTKLRGLRFHGGYHDFRICTGGLLVFPRLQLKVRARAERRVMNGSGSPELDALMGGGVQSGSSLLITGPAGTGKSVLATQFACAAVARGERVAVYLFDERLGTFRQRSEALGTGAVEAMDDGRLHVRQVEPTELSPGEFASAVTDAVERDGARLVIIDSINGYMQSMPEERLLAIQVHELLSYLAEQGCTTIMTLVQRGVFGSPVDEAAEVSYLADAVVLLRYFEVHGTVRQAISVVKNRASDHERTIRECRVGKGGLHVGAPLTEFQGVLTGVPTYTGALQPLMGARASTPSSGNGA